jgi:hypothetical protein
LNAPWLRPCNVLVVATSLVRAQISTWLFQLEKKTKPVISELVFVTEKICRYNSVAVRFPLLYITSICILEDER